MEILRFHAINLLLLFLIQTLQAQETFLKKYLSPDDTHIYSIVETDDNQLIFCGVIWPNPGLGAEFGTMMKISNNGELVSTKTYDFENGNSRFAELINSSLTTGCYFIVGNEDSVSGNQTFNKVFVHTIDNELNITERRYYGMWSESNNSPWDFELLGDTTAYILSFFKYHTSSRENYSLIKADLRSNNYIFYKPNDSIYRAPSSLMIDETNELIKVNYRVFNLPMYPYNPISNISYDLTSVEVVMPDNQFFSQTKIAKKNDSTYFLSGAFIEDIGTQRDLGVAEYNLQDSLLKQIKLPGGIDSVTYPGAGKKNILVTSDYIWVLGWYNTLEVGFPCQIEPTYIVLNKLNFDLELQEQIFYGGDGVYFPRDIIETSDHHIVVAGEFFDNLAVPFNCHFDPFVLKVNSEGLIVNVNNPEKPIAQEAIVLPNPGNEYLQVKLAIQHKTAHFQLFDINGRLVLEENLQGDMQRVSTSSLNSGTYIYRITASNRVIGSGKWVKD